MTTNNDSTTKIERRGRKKSLAPATYKNIAVDADIVLLLQEAKATFAESFHFEPTISQVLRYLIVEATQKQNTHTKETEQAHG